MGPSTNDHNRSREALQLTRVRLPLRVRWLGNGALPKQREPTLVILPSELAWGKSDEARRRVCQRIVEVSRSPSKLRPPWAKHLFLLATVDEGTSRDDIGAYRELMRVTPLGVETIECPGWDTWAAVATGAWQAAADHGWVLLELSMEDLKRSRLLLQSGRLGLEHLFQMVAQSEALPPLASREVLVRTLLRGCHSGEVDLLFESSGRISRLDCDVGNLVLAAQPDKVSVRLRPQGARQNRRLISRGTKRGAPSREGVSRMGTLVALRPGQDEAHLPSGGLHVEHVSAAGEIAPEKYGEFFRTVLAPLRQLEPDDIKMHIRIEGTLGQDLAPGAPEVRRLREAARRLGLTFDIQVRPDTVP